MFSAEILMVIIDTPDTIKEKYIKSHLLSSVKHSIVSSNSNMSGVLGKSIGSKGRKY